MIEESRGCFHNCQFCSNKSVFTTVFQKSAQTLVEEFKRLRDLYDTTFLPTMLVCASFGQFPKETRRFLQLVKSEGLDLEFDAMMRVDNPSIISYCDDLPLVFKQVDFGLESASSEILIRMNKTTRPGAYLRRATDTFKLLHSKNIRVGLNVILGYLGETPETLRQTLEFIFGLKPDGVLPGALMLFPGSPFARLFNRGRCTKFGASLVEGQYYKRMHAFPVNPSSYFSYHEMDELCDSLAKILNSQEFLYHHVKWLVGPRPGKGLGFYPESEIMELIGKVLTV